MQMMAWPDGVRIRGEDESFPLPSVSWQRRERMRVCLPVNTSRRVMC